MNLTTKSGTNAFHGNVFEFFRNEHLNARNYFQKSNPVKPDYRRNQYGRHVRRPPRRRTGLLLCRLSGQRQSIGRTVTSNVPTLAERSGSSARTSTIRRRQWAIRVSSFRTTRFREAPWIRSRCRFSSATRCRQYRQREQLQPDGQRDRRSGSGRCAHRSQVCDRPRSGVRTVELLPGRAVPVTAFPDGSGPSRPAAWPLVRRTRRRGRSRPTINTPFRRTC